jgi:hypothetical protein
LRQIEIKKEIVKNIVNYTDDSDCLDLCSSIEDLDCRVEVPPCEFDAPINGESFLLSLQQIPVLTLEPGDLVIMDNLGSYVTAHWLHPHIILNHGMPELLHQRRIWFPSKSFRSSRANLQT